MAERAFEAELDAAFAAAPPPLDDRAFADAVVMRIAREERRRAALLIAAGVAGVAVLVQTVLATRGFPALLSDWASQAGDLAWSLSSLDASIWMAAGVGMAAVALFKGADA